MRKLAYLGCAAVLFGVAWMATVVPAQSTSHAQTDRPFCLLSSTETLNIYSEPSTATIRVGLIQANRVYPVLATTATADGSWYQVELSDTQSGWVQAQNAQVGGDGCPAVPAIIVTMTAPSIPTATGVSPTATVARTDTRPAIVAGDCPANFEGYVLSRLRVGMDTATVAPSAFAVLREAPASSSAVVGRLSPTTVIVVEDGPYCDEGIVWWLVAGADLSGWTAESSVSTQTYFLLPPLVAEQVPAASPPITPDNAADLALAAVLTVDTNPRQVATSTRQLALTSAGGVVIYDYASGIVQDALTADLMPLLAEDPISAVRFDQYGDFLLIGQQSGQLIIFETTQGIIVRLPTTHTTPILSLHIDPDNRRLLSVSADRVMLWDLGSFDAVNSTLAVLWTAGAPGGRALYGGMLTTDGTPIVLSEQGLLVLDAETGTSDGDFVPVSDAGQVRLLQAPATIGAGRAAWVIDGGLLRRFVAGEGFVSDFEATLAFGGIVDAAVHPDGTLLALSDGNTLVIYGVAERERVAELASAGTTALQFSRDGRALIVQDGTRLAFWTVGGAGD